MSALTFTAHRAAGTVIGRLLAPLEQLAIRRYREDMPASRPVFIVSAPRSGSTMLLQQITNYLDVAYPNNLMASYVHSFYLAHRLSNWWYQNEPHDCFQSNYGKTWQYSMNAPHECGMFWRRWIPDETDFVDEDYLSDSVKQQIRATFSAIINSAQKPLVFKNPFLSRRLRMIRDLFEEALIIFLRRDPLYNSQSILKMRMNSSKGKNDWISVRPRFFERLQQMPIDEQVVWYIHYLETEILEELAQFPAAQTHVVHYEEFCREPKKSIERIRALMTTDTVPVAYRNDMPSQPLDVREGRSVDEKTFERLKEVVKSIDWTPDPVRDEASA